MERSVWTDERVDDAIARIEKRFDRIDERFDRIDDRFDRIDDRFDRVDDRFDRMRGEIASSNRQFALIGWTLAGVVVAQLIAIAFLG